MGWDLNIDTSASYQYDILHNYQIFLHNNQCSRVCVCVRGWGWGWGWWWKIYCTTINHSNIREIGVGIGGGEYV